MYFHARLPSLIILGLFSKALATDGGHDTPSKLPVCPASCVQTVTITSTGSCLNLPSTIQTSTASYFETRTNDGVYVNVTTSLSVPYTTVVIPSATITESATISEYTSSTHAYHNYNSTSAAPGVASSSTSTNNYILSTSMRSEETSLASISSPTIALIDTTSVSSVIPSKPTVKPNRCHHDNCLRQFIRHSQVTDFCATYTAVVNTATSDFPDYISQCRANPTRISSACACIVTPAISSNPSSTLIQTTKTAGGVFTSLPVDTAAPTTAQSCTLSSVIFETYTTTSTFSVIVSAGVNGSISTDSTPDASSAPISSFTSIPYFNSTAELMTSLATSTR